MSELTLEKIAKAKRLLEKNIARIKSHDWTKDFVEQKTPRQVLQETTWIKLNDQR